MRTSRVLTAAAVLLAAPFARATEPPLREILRDGLYAEEVSRDPEAAAKQYEQLLARYAADRDFAASALFRLAEVRRKQDRKDDAIQLYQRLLIEFPAAENETKLARENLTALGGTPAPAGPVPMDAEAQQLAKLQADAKSSPDVLLDPQNLRNAVSQGMPKVVAALLAAGSRPYDGDALTLAAQNGNLEIVRMLLEKDGAVPPELARLALGIAIEQKRYTVLGFLLERGLLAASQKNEGSLLAVALLQDQYPAAEILLKHGADLNEMTDPLSDPKGGGAPLHDCIRAGKFEAVAWLLEKGAKPDLATPRYGITPLHLAVTLDDPGSLAMMEKLLAAGADPNHISGPDTANDNTDRPELDATPLETAIGLSRMNVEKVTLLLKHGGKTDRKGSRAASMLGDAIWNGHPNVVPLTRVLGEAGLSMKYPWIIQGAAEKGGSELVSLVLKYGADPNAKDEKGRSLLVKACEADDIGMAKALLTAGADPRTKTATGESIFRLAAQRPSLELLKLLVDAGLAPDPDWKVDRYNGASHEAVDFLLDRFILPELTAEKGAIFVMDLVHGLETVPIWDGITKEQPPLLARWLLERADKKNFAYAGERQVKYEWLLCRKNAGGAVEKTKLDLAGNDPFPILKAGDVVLCRLAPPVEAYNFSWQRMTPDMEWSLKKRIAFPVTVTIDGKSREVTVRGDRLIFDPTKPEVPLVDAQQVVDFLWQPPAYAASHPGTILVKRQGWPEVRMAYASYESKKFLLETGDEITLDLPPDAAVEMAKLRPLSVALTAVGIPFTRSFGDSRVKPSGPRPALLHNGSIGISADDSEAIPATLPTLIQALVETQVPTANNWKEWATSAASGAADLAAAGRVFDGFEILPHPDLSRIRIRRLAEDGKETVTEVDLATAMTPDLTPEAARKADVILRGGDIVEIPLKDTDAPWKGFSEEEKRFFGKALAGKVQVTDPDGTIAFAEINCQSPDFIATSGGWLPVPAKSGTPSTRAWWVIGNRGGELRRGGESSRLDPGSVFLRNGDEWKSTDNNDVRGQLRQPRPRVIPPPSMGNSLPSPIR